MKTACVLAVAAGIALPTATAWGAEREPEAVRLRAGVLELHPTATLSAVYDDNIFKVHDSGVYGLEPVEDVYLTVRPQLQARIPFGYRSFAAAGYAWQGVKYSGGIGEAASGLPESTVWDTFNTHELFAEVDFRTTGGLGFSLRDDFERKSLFLTATELAVQAPTELEPVPLYQHEIKPTLTYDLEGSNLNFETGYRLNTDRFATPRYDYLDKNLHRPYGKVSYRFFPRTAAFVEGEGYLVRYAEPGKNAAVPKANAGGWKAWLGAEGAVTGRLNAVAALGRGRLAYTADVPTAEVWLARLEVSHRRTERTRYALGATRDLFDAYSTNYFVSNRVYAEVWQSLAPTVAAVVGGSYFVNDYSEPYARVDHGVLASAKVEAGSSMYDWLRFSLGYTREQRRSDFDWFSYHANQIFLETEAAL